MRWSYDSEMDALYLWITAAPPAGQDELADGTIVDIDAAGELAGIEVLGLKRGWSPTPVIDRFGLGPDAAAAIVFVAGTLSGHPIAPSRAEAVLV